MSNPPSKPAGDKAAPVAAKPATDKPASAALPDAALLDREDDGADATATPAPKSGIRRFLPSSVLGWTAAASILVVTLGGSAAAAFLFAFDSGPAADPAISGAARALDGRTLVVAGQVVHLQDIEAPPAALICRDGGWEYKCGEDSRKALEQLVANRQVDCTPSPSANGALIAQCRSEQGVDVAAAMVEAGWAIADLRRSSRYFPQQATAQNESRGLWRNNFAYPEQWRLAARGESR